MMVMLNRFYKCSAGFVFGCLICFLAVGCGGKSDSPEKGKQTQEIVRQKIPSTEQKPEAAKPEPAKKKQKKTPQPDKASTVQPAEKETPPAAKADSPQASEPVEKKETPAVPAAQPETVSTETTKALSADKKAEIDSITKDAEKAAKTAMVNEQAGKSAPAVQKPAQPGNLEESNESPEEAPVIDLGNKGTEKEEEMAAESEEESAEDAYFNPFSPLFQKEDTGVAVTELPSFRERREFLTPLEKIDIGQLTLKGIIQAQSGNRAIVTDASGEGYVIKKGTYVGLNSGTVEKIESDRVVIVESIGTRQSQTVLKLQKPAGE